MCSRYRRQKVLPCSARASLRASEISLGLLGETACLAACENFSSKEIRRGDRSECCAYSGDKRACVCNADPTSWSGIRASQRCAKRSGDSGGMYLESCSYSRFNPKRTRDFVDDIFVRTSVALSNDCDYTAGRAISRRSTLIWFLFGYFCRRAILAKTSWSFSTFFFCRDCFELQNGDHPCRRTLGTPWRWIPLMESMKPFRSMVRCEKGVGGCMEDALSNWIVDSTLFYSATSLSMDYGLGFWKRLLGLFDDANTTMMVQQIL